jgi:hypothetical protein
MNSFALESLVAADPDDILELDEWRDEEDRWDDACDGA